MPKKLLTPLEVKEWSDENFINTASVLKEGRTEGVSIKTTKKYGNTKTPRKSLWLQKDQKVDEIMDWLFSTVKEFFSKFWGKDIVTKEEIEAKSKLIEDLRNQLKKREDELDETKIKFELQQKELALAYEVVDKFEEYRLILDDFENKIKGSVIEDKRIEEWIKNKLREHRWILGLDCEVKAKNKSVDTQTEIDMHIETNFGEDRIIEVKSPNISIFGKNKNKRYDISGEITKGLSELIEYMQRTQSYAVLKQKGTYGLDKPIGRILVGYELEEDQTRLLNDWNFYLGPAIKIINYKSLIENARREIEIIKLARQKSKLNQ